MEKPNGPPSASKHKSMDSDEDDEEPQNEPGTSSTSQAPTLMTKTVSIAMCTAHEVRTLDGYCATQIRSHLIDDEHWTVTPETHKCAAAAGSHSVL